MKYLKTVSVDVLGENELCIYLEGSFGYPSRIYIYFMNSINTSVYVVVYIICMYHFVLPHVEVYCEN